MHVVATAGHVDHGKSTLVEALTGRNPDRLEEERRRGLTIELGYCWTDLDGVGEVAFVDVPGHQRFIATTLAGVGPVPVVMFVVAADDPWMPQAAEHLAALDALRVEHGVLVVTRSDLAEPEPVLQRAMDELGRTSLAGIPAVTVSGRTGQGIEELRATLAGVLQHAPRPDPGTDVRLWVDRRFHVRGAGTVVTGTLSAGTISIGDVLEADGERVRVRGLEALEIPRERISGPARVALDLGGHAPPTIARGSVLMTPARFAPATVLDVRVTDGGRLPERPLLHVGSALLGVHARPLGEGFARLTLETPVPFRVGDRGLLRDPGDRTLWGIQVLDPMPPPITRRGGAAARAQVLERHDGSLACELETRGVVRRSELLQIGVPLEPAPAGSVRAGDWLISAERARLWRQQLAGLVEDNPALAPPLTPAAAAHRLGLPDPEIVPALVEPPLRLDRGAIVGSGSAAVPDELAPAMAALHADLVEHPFAAPDRTRMRELGLDARAVATLERGGHVLRLGDDVVLLPGADQQALEVLRGLPQPFTTSHARQALGTNRRVALALLTRLDRTSRTVRLADDTRRVASP